MKKSNQFQSNKYAQEKTITHTAIGRRLPSTPISTQILSISRIALATANSSLRINELVNNTVNCERYFSNY